MRTLITFLGRTSKGESGYRTAQYDFGDGMKTDPVAFFGWVLIERLRRDGVLNRVVILGTSGSSWDQLVEKDLELSGINEEKHLFLMESIESQQVTQQQLDEFSPLLSESLNLDIQMVLIPYCREPSEQVELLRIFDQQVNEGEQLDLDVTHGFRHLPMLSLLAALFLKTVRGVEIKSIWYGAYDPDTGFAPVHDLIGLLEIADWMQGLITYDKDGDYSVFSRLLGGARGELLSESAFLERISNNVVASQKLGSWMGIDERVDHDHPAAALFQPILEERLQWYKRSDRSRQEQALAWIYLKKHDYLRAVIYGMEGVITADCEKSGSCSNEFDVREKAKERLRENRDGFFKKLGQIRNALAHGIRSNKGIIKILKSEKTLDNTLKRLFKKLNIRK